MQKFLGRFGIVLGIFLLIAAGHLYMFWRYALYASPISGTLRTQNWETHTYDVLCFPFTLWIDMVKWFSFKTQIYVSASTISITAFMIEAVAVYVAGLYLGRGARWCCRWIHRPVSVSDTEIVDAPKGS